MIPWLVAFEIPSEIGQSKFKHPLDKLEDNSYKESYNNKFHQLGVSNLLPFTAEIGSVDLSVVQGRLRKGEL